MNDGNNISENKNSSKGFLTVEQLARILNVPESWIYDRTRRGGPERIPHFKFGKYIRFSEEEVLNYLQSKSVAEQ